MTDSYGSPSTEEDLNLHIDALVINEVGENNIGIVFNSINSYGNLRSPDTGNKLNPCLIMTRGNVGGYNFSIFVYDSYGLFYHHSYIYTNCMKGAMKYETT